MYSGWERLTATTRRSGRWTCPSRSLHRNPPQNSLACSQILRRNLPPKKIAYLDEQHAAVVGEAIRSTEQSTAIGIAGCGAWQPNAQVGINILQVRVVSHIDRGA